MADHSIQYLSQDSFEKFNGELSVLKHEKIPAIARRIDEARQMGDLSENAEYHSAREEMAWAQTRVKELEQILADSEIISKPSSTHTVEIGSSLTVEGLNGSRKYTIVGPHEANPLKGHISNESPLGQSFLGRKIGDLVAVHTPSGDQTYTIVDII